MMPFAGSTAPFRTHRQSMNIAMQTTEAGEGQAFIVASVPGEEDAASAARALYTMIADTLCDKRMEIVHERIFGSLSMEAAVRRERKTVLSGRQSPVTYVEGDPPWGEGLAGIIIHAVASDSTNDVWTIMDDGMPCGRGWRRDGSTYFMLQSIQALTPPILPLSKGRCEEGLSSHPLSRPSQARRMFDRADRILRRYGSS